MITIYHVMDLIRTLYWGVMWVVLAGVLFLIVKVVPAGGWKRLAAMAAALIAIPGAFYVLPRLSIWAEQNTSEAREARTRYETAKAIFDERCKQAGEKIYRTASGVEGITLLNVPKTRSELATSSYIPERDPMWPEAALPEETWGTGYIDSFLDGRERLVRKPVNMQEHIGFQFIDTQEDFNKYKRYQWNIEEKRYTDEYLLSSEIDPPTARYAVRYEALVDPADRQYSVAGAKVTVIDQQNNEVMATKTWYALESGQGASSGSSVRQFPWKFAMTCPEDGRKRETVSIFSGERG